MIEYYLLAIMQKKVQKPVTKILCEIIQINKK